MKDFFKRNKYNLLIVFLVGFFIYSIRIIFKVISIDTEVLINEPNILLNSWMSIGRFGLVLIKKIFNLIPINIQLTNIFTFVIFYMSVVIWMINIEKWEKSKNKYEILIFGILLIASPIFAEQFGFTLQSLEIAMAFLIFAVSIYFQEKYIETNKIWFALIIISTLVFSFMCYQAFMFLYITICIFNYFIKYKGKMDCKIIIKYIVIFVIAVVLYFIINEILLNVLDIQKTSYLMEQIKWGTSNFFWILLRMIAVNIVTTNIFMGVLFDIIIACLFVLFSKILFKKYKVKENKIFYLIFIAFFISPFLSGIIKGDVEIYRAKFSLAFLIAFGFYYVINNIEQFKLKKMIISFTFMIIVIQIIYSFCLFFIDYQRYKEDIEIGNKINSIIEKMDLEKPVVFVGKKEFKNFPIIGETLGHSFFAWDSTEICGGSKRAIGFLKTLGIYYKLPSQEEIEKADTEAVNMPNWPEDGSIVEKEDLIIVKLSESKRNVEK